MQAFRISTSEVITWSKISIDGEGKLYKHLKHTPLTYELKWHHGTRRARRGWVRPVKRRRRPLRARQRKWRRRRHRKQRSGRDRHKRMKCPLHHWQERGNGERPDLPRADTPAPQHTLQPASAQTEEIADMTEPAEDTEHAAPGQANLIPRNRRWLLPEDQSSTLKACLAGATEEATSAFLRALEQSRRNNPRDPSNRKQRRHPEQWRQLQTRPLLEAIQAAGTLTKGPTVAGPEKSTSKGPDAHSTGETETRADRWNRVGRELLEADWEYISNITQMLQRTGLGVHITTTIRSLQSYARRATDARQQYIRMGQLSTDPDDPCRGYWMDAAYTAYKQAAAAQSRTQRRIRLSLAEAKSQVTHERGTQTEEGSTRERGPTTRLGTQIAGRSSLTQDGTRNAPRTQDKEVARPRGPNRASAGRAAVTTTDDRKDWQDQGATNTPDVGQEGTGRSRQTDTAQAGIRQACRPDPGVDWHDHGAVGDLELSQEVARVRRQAEAEKKMSSKAGQSVTGGERHDKSRTSNPEAGRPDTGGERHDQGAASDTDIGREVANASGPAEAAQKVLRQAGRLGPGGGRHEQSAASDPVSGQDVARARSQAEAEQKVIRQAGQPDTGGDSQDKGMTSNPEDGQGMASVSSQAKTVQKATRQAGRPNTGGDRQEPDAASNTETSQEVGRGSSQADTEQKGSSPACRSDTGDDRHDNGGVRVSNQVKTTDSSRQSVGTTTEGRDDRHEQGIARTLDTGQGEVGRSRQADVEQKASNRARRPDAGGDWHDHGAVRDPELGQDAARTRRQAETEQKGTSQAGQPDPGGGRQDKSAASDTAIGREVASGISQAEAEQQVSSQDRRPDPDDARQAHGATNEPEIRQNAASVSNLAAAEQKVTSQAGRPDTGGDRHDKGVASAPDSGGEADNGSGPAETAQRMLSQAGRLDPGGGRNAQPTASNTGSGHDVARGSRQAAAEPQVTRQDRRPDTGNDRQVQDAASETEDSTGGGHDTRTRQGGGTTITTGSHVWVHGDFWSDPTSSFQGDKLDTTPRWDTIRGKLHTLHETSASPPMIGEQVKRTSTAADGHSTITEWLTLPGNGHEPDTLGWRLRHRNGRTKDVTDEIAYRRWRNRNRKQGEHEHTEYWPATIVGSTNRFDNHDADTEWVLLCPEQVNMWVEPPLYVISKTDTGKYLRLPSATEDPHPADLMRFYTTGLHTLDRLNQPCHICDTPWGREEMIACGSTGRQCPHTAHLHCITAAAANPRPNEESWLKHRKQWCCKTCDATEAWGASQPREEIWTEEDFGKSTRIQICTALRNKWAHRPSVGSGACRLLNGRLPINTPVLVEHRVWGIIGCHVSSVGTPSGYQVTHANKGTWRIGEGAGITGAGRAAAINERTPNGTTWRIAEQEWTVTGVEPNGTIVLTTTNTEGPLQTRSLSGDHLKTVGVQSPTAHHTKHRIGLTYPHLTPLPDGIWAPPTQGANTCRHLMRRTRLSEAWRTREILGLPQLCDGCKEALCQDEAHWQCDREQDPPCALTYCIKCAWRKTHHTHTHQEGLVVEMMTVTTVHQSVSSWSAQDTITALSDEQAGAAAHEMKTQHVGGTRMSTMTDRAYLRGVVGMAERRCRQLARINDPAEARLPIAGLSDAQALAKLKVMITKAPEVQDPELWSRGWRSIGHAAGRAIGPNFGGISGLIHALDMPVGEIIAGIGNPTLRLLAQNIPMSPQTPTQLVNKEQWAVWMTAARSGPTRPQLLITWEGEDKPEWTCGADTNIFHHMSEISVEGRSCADQTRGWTITGIPDGDLQICLSATEQPSGTDRASAEDWLRSRHMAVHTRTTGCERGARALRILTQPHHTGQIDNETAALRVVICHATSTAAATAEVIHRFGAPHGTPAKHPKDTCFCWPCIQDKVRRIKGEHRPMDTTEENVGVAEEPQQDGAYRLLGNNIVASTNTWRVAARDLPWLTPKRLIMVAKTQRSKGAPPRPKPARLKSFFTKPTKKQVEAAQAAQAAEERQWKQATRWRLPGPLPTHYEEWRQFVCEAAAAEGDTYIQLPVSPRQVQTRTEETSLQRTLVRTNKLTSAPIRVKGHTVRLHFGTAPPTDFWTINHLTIRLTPCPHQSAGMRAIPLAQGTWWRGNSDDPAGILRTTQETPIVQHTGPMVLWLDRDPENMGIGLAVAERLLTPDGETADLNKDGLDRHTASATLQEWADEQHISLRMTEAKRAWFNWMGILINTGVLLPWPDRKIHAYPEAPTAGATEATGQVEAIGTGGRSITASWKDPPPPPASIGAQGRVRDWNIPEWNVHEINPHDAFPALTNSVQGLRCRERTWKDPPWHHTSRSHNDLGTAIPEGESNATIMLDWKSRGGIPVKVDKETATTLLQTLMAQLCEPPLLGRGLYTKVRVTYTVAANCLVIHANGCPASWQKDVTIRTQDGEGRFRSARAELLATQHRRYHPNHGVGIQWRAMGTGNPPVPEMSDITIRGSNGTSRFQWATFRTERERTHSEARYRAWQLTHQETDAIIFDKAQGHTGRDIWKCETQIRWNQEHGRTAGTPSDRAQDSQEDKNEEETATTGDQSSDEDHVDQSGSELDPEDEEDEDNWDNQDKQESEAYSESSEDNREDQRWADSTTEGSEDSGREDTATRHKEAEEAGWPDTRRLQQAATHQHQKAIQGNDDSAWDKAEQAAQAAATDHARYWAQTTSGSPAGEHEGVWDIQDAPRERSREAKQKAVRKVHRWLRQKDKDSNPLPQQGEELGHPIPALSSMNQTEIGMLNEWLCWPQEAAQPLTMTTTLRSLLHGFPATVRDQGEWRILNPSRPAEWKGKLTIRIHTVDFYPDSDTTEVIARHGEALRTHLGSQAEIYITSQTPREAGVEQETNTCGLVAATVLAQLSRMRATDWATTDCKEATTEAKWSEGNDILARQDPTWENQTGSKFITASQVMEVTNQLALAGTSKPTDIEGFLNDELRKGITMVAQEDITELTMLLPVGAGGRQGRGNHWSATALHITTDSNTENQESKAEDQGGERVEGQTGDVGGHRTSHEVTANSIVTPARATISEDASEADEDPIMTQEGFEITKGYTYTCNTCGTAHASGQPSTDIAVRVHLPTEKGKGKDTDTYQLQSLLRRTMEDRKDSTITCTHCRKGATSEATESARVLILPNCLRIQLLRFTRSQGKTQKNNSQVHVPLSGLVYGGATYDLHAAIEHQGQTAGGGHYTCVTRRARNQWRRWDDAKDKETDITDPGWTSTQAYVLHYRRREYDLRDDTTDGVRSQPLCNIGQSCFMNAALQSLLLMPGALPPPTREDERAQHTTAALQTIRAHIAAGHTPDRHRMENLRKSLPQFRDGNQHDVMQFLESLTAKLREEGQDGNRISPGATTATGHPQQGEKTIHKTTEGKNRGRQARTEDSTGGAASKVKTAPTPLAGSSWADKQWHTDLNNPDQDRFIAAAVNNAATCGQARMSQHLDAMTTAGWAITALTEPSHKGHSKGASWKMIADELQQQVTKWKGPTTGAGPSLVTHWPAEKRSEHKKNSGIGCLVHERFRIGAVAEADAQGRWLHIQVFPSDQDSAISIIVIYGWAGGSTAEKEALMEEALESAARARKGEQTDATRRFTFDKHTKVHNMRHRGAELETLAEDEDRQGNFAAGEEIRSKIQEEGAEPFFSVAQATLMLGDFNMTQPEREDFFARQEPEGRLEQASPKNIPTRLSNHAIDAAYHGSTDELKWLQAGVDKEGALLDGYMDNADHDTVIVAYSMSERLRLGDPARRQALSDQITAAVLTDRELLRSTEVLAHHAVIPLAGETQQLFVDNMVEDSDKAITAAVALRQSISKGMASPREAAKRIGEAASVLLLTASGHLAPLVLHIPRKPRAQQESAMRRGVDQLLQQIQQSIRKAKGMSIKADAQERDEGQTQYRAMALAMEKRELCNKVRQANLIMAAMHENRVQEIRTGESLERWSSTTEALGETEKASHPPVIELWGGRMVTDTWGGRNYTVVGSWLDPTNEDLRNWSGQKMDSDMHTLTELRGAYRKHGQLTQREEHSRRIDALGEGLRNRKFKNIVSSICGRNNHAKASGPFNPDMQLIGIATTGVFPNHTTTTQGMVIRDKQELVEYWSLWYSSFFRSTTEFHQTDMDDPVRALQMTADEGQEEGSPSLQTAKDDENATRSVPLDALLDPSYVRARLTHYEETRSETRIWSAAEPRSYAYTSSRAWNDASPAVRAFGPQRRMNGNLPNITDVLMALDDTEFEELIKNLPMGSAAGPSLMSYEAVKILPTEWKDLTREIINACLKFGVMPKNLKIGYQVPIPKKLGIAQSIENSRPITLLEVVFKLLEKVLNDRLYPQLEREGMLDDGQFGFRRGMGIQNPLSILNSILETAYQFGRPAHVALLDLASAFPSCESGPLRAGYDRIGIPADVVVLLHDLDVEHARVVRAMQHESKIVGLTRGTAQGSILSPIKFSILLQTAITCLHEIVEEDPSIQWRSPDELVSTMKKIRGSDMPTEPPREAYIRLPSRNTDGSRLATQRQRRAAAAATGLAWFLYRAEAEGKAGVKITKERVMSMQAEGIDKEDWEWVVKEHPWFVNSEQHIRLTQQADARKIIKQAMKEQWRKTGATGIFFADDSCLVARSAYGLQRLIDGYTAVLGAVGISANAGKCMYAKVGKPVPGKPKSTMFMKTRTWENRASILPKDQQMGTWAHTDPARYLGIWFSTCQSWTKQQESIKQKFNIVQMRAKNFQLTPALSRFFFSACLCPRTAFRLTLERHDRRATRALDRKAAAAILRSSGTPSHSSPALIFAAEDRGGLGARSIHNEQIAAIATECSALLMDPGLAGHLMRKRLEAYGEILRLPEGTNPLEVPWHKISERGKKERDGHLWARCHEHLAKHGFQIRTRLGNTRHARNNIGESEKTSVATPTPRHHKLTQDGKLRWQDWRIIDAVGPHLEYIAQGKKAVNHEIANRTQHYWAQMHLAGGWRIKDVLTPDGGLDTWKSLRHRDKELPQRAPAWYEYLANVLPATTRPAAETEAALQNFAETNWITNAEDAVEDTAIQRPACLFPQDGLETQARHDPLMDNPTQPPPKGTVALWRSQPQATHPAEEVIIKETTEMGAIIESTDGTRHEAEWGQLLLREKKRWPTRNAMVFYRQEQHTAGRWAIGWAGPEARTNLEEGTQIRISRTDQPDLMLPLAQTQQTDPPQHRQLFRAMRNREEGETPWSLEMATDGSHKDTGENILASNAAVFGLDGSPDKVVSACFPLLSELFPRADKATAKLEDDDTVKYLRKRNPHCLATDMPVNFNARAMCSTRQEFGPLRAIYERLGDLTDRADEPEQWLRATEPTARTNKEVHSEDEGTREEQQNEEAEREEPGRQIHRVARSVSHDRRPDTRYPRGQETEDVMDDKETAQEDLSPAPPTTRPPAGCYNTIWTQLGYKAHRPHNPAWICISNLCDNQTVHKFCDKLSRDRDYVRQTMESPRQLCKESYRADKQALLRLGMKYGIDIVSKKVASHVADKIKEAEAKQLPVQEAWLTQPEEDTRRNEEADRICAMAIASSHTPSQGGCRWDPYEAAAVVTFGGLPLDGNMRRITRAKLIQQWNCRLRNCVTQGNMGQVIERSRAAHEFADTSQGGDEEDAETHRQRRTCRQISVKAGKAVTKMDSFAGMSIPGSDQHLREVGENILRARSRQLYDIRHAARFEQDLIPLLTPAGAEEPDYSCIYCNSDEEFGEAHGLGCEGRQQAFTKLERQQQWLPAETGREAVKVERLRREPREWLLTSIAAMRQGYGTDIGIHSSTARARRQIAAKQECTTSTEPKWANPRKAEKSRTMATDWVVQQQPPVQGQKHGIRVETAASLSDTKRWNMAHGGAARQTCISRWGKGADKHTGADPHIPPELWEALAELYQIQASGHNDVRESAHNHGGPCYCLHQEQAQGWRPTGEAILPDNEINERTDIWTDTKGDIMIHPAHGETQMAETIDAAIQHVTGQNAHVIVVMPYIIEGRQSEAILHERISAFTEAQPDTVITQTILDIPKGRLTKIDHEYWAGLRNYNRLGREQCAGGFRFIRVTAPGNTAGQHRAKNAVIQKVKRAIQSTVAGGGLDLAIMLPPEKAPAGSDPDLHTTTQPGTWLPLAPDRLGTRRTDQVSHDHEILGASGSLFEPGLPSQHGAITRALHHHTTSASEMHDEGLGEHLKRWETAWVALQRRQTGETTKHLWKEMHQPMTVPAMLLDLAALQDIPTKMSTAYASMMTQHLAVAITRIHQQLKKEVVKRMKESGVQGKRLPPKTKPAKGENVHTDNQTTRIRGCTTRFWEGTGTVPCKALTNRKDGKCTACSQRTKQSASGLARLANTMCECPDLVEEYTTAWSIAAPMALGMDHKQINTCLNSATERQGLKMPTHLRWQIQLIYYERSRGSMLRHPALFGNRLQERSNQPTIMDMFDRGEQGEECTFSTHDSIGEGFMAGLIKAAPRSSLWEAWQRSKGTLKEWIQERGDAPRSWQETRTWPSQRVSSDTADILSPTTETTATETHTCGTEKHPSQLQTRKLLGRMLQPYGRIPTTTANRGLEMAIHNATRQNSRTACEACGRLRTAHTNRHPVKSSEILAIDWSDQPQPPSWNSPVLIQTEEGHTVYRTTRLLVRALTEAEIERHATNWQRAVEQNNDSDQEPTCMPSRDKAALARQWTLHNANSIIPEAAGSVQIIFLKRVSHSTSPSAKALATKQKQLQAIQTARKSRQREAQTRGGQAGTIISTGNSCHLAAAIRVMGHMSHTLRNPRLNRRKEATNSCMDIVRDLYETDGIGHAELNTLQQLMGGKWSRDEPQNVWNTVGRLQAIMYENEAQMNPWGTSWKHEGPRCTPGTGCTSTDISTFTTQSFTQMVGPEENIAQVFEPSWKGREFQRTPDAKTTQKGFRCPQCEQPITLETPSQWGELMGVQINRRTARATLNRTATVIPLRLDATVAGGGVDTFSLTLIIQRSGPLKQGHYTVWERRDGKGEWRNWDPQEGRRSGRITQLDSGCNDEGKEVHHSTTAVGLVYGRIAAAANAPGKKGAQEQDGNKQRKRKYTLAHLRSSRNKRRRKQKTDELARDAVAQAKQAGEEKADTGHKATNATGPPTTPDQQNTAMPSDQDSDNEPTATQETHTETTTPVTTAPENTTENTAPGIISPNNPPIQGDGAPANRIRQKRSKPIKINRWITSARWARRQSKKHGKAVDFFILSPQRKKSRAQHPPPTREQQLTPPPPPPPIPRPPPPLPINPPLPPGTPPRRPQQEQEQTRDFTTGSQQDQKHQDQYTDQTTANSVGAVTDQNQTESKEGLSRRGGPTNGPLARKEEGERWRQSLSEQPQHKRGHGEGREGAEGDGKAEPVAKRHATRQRDTRRHRHYDGCKRGHNQASKRERERDDTEASEEGSGARRKTKVSQTPLDTSEAADITRWARAAHRYDTHFGRGGAQRDLSWITQSTTASISGVTHMPRTTERTGDSEGQSGASKTGSKRVRGHSDEGAGSGGGGARRSKGGTGSQGGKGEQGDRGGKRGMSNTRDIGDGRSTGGREDRGGVPGRGRGRPTPAWITRARGPGLGSPNNAMITGHSETAARTNRLQGDSDSGVGSGGAADTTGRDGASKETKEGERDGGRRGKGSGSGPGRERGDKGVEGGRGDKRDKGRAGDIGNGLPKAAAVQRNNTPTPQSKAVDSEPAASDKGHQGDSGNVGGRGGGSIHSKVGGGNSSGHSSSTHSRSSRCGNADDEEGKEGGGAATGKRKRKKRKQKPAKEGSGEGGHRASNGAGGGGGEGREGGRGVGGGIQLPEETRNDQMKNSKPQLSQAARRRKKKRDQKHEGDAA